MKLSVVKQMETWHTARILIYSIFGLDALSFYNHLNTKFLLSSASFSGALVTAGVLTAGLISFRYGNSQLGQKLMRARVIAQGATVALMIGSAYYYGDQIKLFKKGSSPWTSMGIAVFGVWRMSCIHWNSTWTLLFAPFNIGLNHVILAWHVIGNKKSVLVWSGGLNNNLFVD